MGQFWPNIRDAPIIGVGQLPIIGIGRLSAILPIIGNSRLVRWYRLIVVYTVGKYEFLFLLPKVNEHESRFLGVFCKFAFATGTSGKNLCKNYNATLRFL